MSGYDEYKVIDVVEGGCGTILLGSSKIPLKKMEDVLNREAKDSWQLIFQLVETKRYLLFWQRESVILTFARKKNNNETQVSQTTIENTNNEENNNSTD